MSGKGAPATAFTITQGAYKNYTPQSVHYKDNKIYVPIWGGGLSIAKQNESVILVYDYIGGATKMPIEAWEFIRDGKEKFEIEGCGFYENELWFNTNGPTAAGNIYKIDPKKIK